MAGFSDDQSYDGVGLSAPLDDEARAIRRAGRLEAARAWAQRQPPRFG